MVHRFRAAQPQSFQVAQLLTDAIGMLEKHYSHLDAVKAIHQLRGEESRQLIQADTVIDEKYRFDESKAKKRR